MTPGALEELVLNPKDFWPLQQALAPLTEKERAKLSTHAQKLYSQLSRNKPGENASDRLTAYFADRKGEGWNFWNAATNRCATLALFGLCPGSVLKKRGIFIFHHEHAVFERIVEDRRPEWLDDWLEHTLGEQFTSVSFNTLRRWIKSGLCKKPETDGYYQRFAIHLMRTPRHNSDEIVPPLSRQLLDDRDLLEDIDGLFRVESIAFNTNSWLTRGAPQNYETWPDALVKLSAEGHLDREHLLAKALEGLRLDLKQNQLSGFHGLYRRLAPTRDERLRHQPDYVALLCHPVGHVVKFALDMLNDLDKDGVLDGSLVLGEMPLVLVGESKGNATAALKLIGRIIGRRDALEGLALGTASEALRHASAEVQGQALTLLEKHASRLNDAQLEALANLETFVAASNRERLSALLSARRTNAVPTPPVRPVRPDAGPYVVMSADINDQRVLFPEGRLTPITSVDALIDALFHAVEVVESPDEVELIIDGIGRLAADRPADFAARVAPLQHRLRSQPPNNKGLITTSFGIGGALWDLLGTWISGRLVDTARKPERHETSNEGFVPLSAHLNALAKRVAQGRACVLLSAPTHKGGWIDPLVWVERLKQTPGDDVAGNMDLRLSLLRLAPDNRREALAALDGVSEALRRIAAFALGGKERPGKADRGAYAAWISAARCRAPYGDWREPFEGLDLADAWMDSLAPARYGWQSSHRKQKFQNQTFKFPRLDISTGTADAEAARKKPGGFLAGLAQAVSNPQSTSWEALPSAALVRGVEQERHWHTQYELYAVWLTRWLPYIWPQNPSAVYMKAAKGLATNIDEAGGTWGPRFGFFYALFQKNRPWREAGHLLLCLGLAARDADVRGLAVDALIEGIDSRVFDPDLFAATVTRVAAGEWLKLNRLGENLMTVVQASPLHAEVVGDVVQKWLPRFDHRQTNGFAILEVLLEVQAVTGRPLAPEAKACLDTITGSSKVAKIAQQLLKRDVASRK